MLDRIVIINDTSVARGGAATIAINSARWLRSRSVPVTFLAADHGRNPVLTAAGVDLIGMGQEAIVDIAGRTAVTRGIYNRRAAQLLNDWIDANDTPQTIYHLHQWAHILSPSVFRALRPVASRLVLTAHDYFLVCPNGGFMNFRQGSSCGHAPLGIHCLRTDCDKRNYGHKLWRVARQLMRMALFNLGHSNVPILVLHERMAPHFLAAGAAPAHIRVLRNPVEPFTSHRIRAEHNRDFIFVGRVEPVKGADLAACAARRAGVPLRVIGDGPLRPELQRLYPDVKFDGWLPREDISRIARGARALVMPSLWAEPFGLVAVEALRSGLPVITAADAFLAHEITTMGIGVACDPRDTEALAHTMQSIAADGKLVERMSLRAFLESTRIATTPSSWTDAVWSIYEERVLAASQLGRYRAVERSQVTA